MYSILLFHVCVCVCAKNIRWQQEVSETVFETVNFEADKVELKRKSKQKNRFDADEKESDCILHGYIKKLGGAFASVWQTRYAKLYPNR